MAIPSFRFTTFFLQQTLFLESFREFLSEKFIKSQKREIEIPLKGKPKKATGFKPPLKMVFLAGGGFIRLCSSSKCSSSSSSFGCGLRFFPTKRFVMYVADGGVVSLGPPLLLAIALLLVVVVVVHVQLTP